MLGLFWDLYQQRQISHLQSDVRNGKSEAQAVARREASSQQEFAERFDKLTLVMHAMWTLLSERTNVTEAELLQRITDIDAQDGTVDGKVTPRQVKCSCGATVCAKFQRCLFCGKEHPTTGAFV